MDIKILTDEELVELLKENNFSMAGIEKKYGLSKMTVSRLLNKRKINYAEELDSYKKSQKEQYEESPKLCKHCGKPIPWGKRANDYCNISCSTSENNKGKIRNPLGGRANKNRKKKEKVCVICGEKNCTNEFCKNHNTQQLNGLVKHLGFDSSAIGTKNVFREFDRVKQLVYNLYWNQGYSRADIGKEFKYPCDIIPTNVLTKTLGIPTRSLSDAIENSYIQGKSTIPKVNLSTGLAANVSQGWYITWEGKKVYIRSSYEERFAKKLDEGQISYSVEDLRIEYYDSQQDKTRIAIPDFYLPDFNEIVEIKSDFTLDIQEMRDKFDAYKKQGYIPKLILENEEIDLENLENLINDQRLDKIKNRNINQFRNKNKSQ